MLSVGDLAPSFKRHPVCGMDIDTAAITETRPVALVFLRYAGSAGARRIALDLHEVWPELDQHDVALVVVTEGGGITARDFVPRYHLLYPVVHDEHSELYSAYKVGHDRFLLRTLAALPTVLPDWLKSLTNGHGRLDGPLTRLPAACVVAPGGQVAWAWEGRRVTDALDVHAFANAALAARVDRKAVVNG